MNESARTTLVRLWPSCIAVVAMFAAAQARADQSPLQLQPCAPEQLMGGNAAERCGWLTVPENRDDPASRTLRLRVTVLPSLRAQPERDALVILAGGPGQGAHQFYPGIAGAFNGVRRDRDIVLIDQRGTGDSNRLDCAFDNSVDLETADPQVVAELAGECLKKLPGDPRFYTTSVAVRDLEEARVALGYSQWSLYAVSYGTRVAQHYRHRYPQNVRAMILDGVVPVDLALGPDAVPRAQQALDALFARCAADASCNEKFPKIGEQFAALHARVTKEPLRARVPDPITSNVSESAFGVQQLNAAVRLLTYSDETASLLPLLIHGAQTEGTPEPLIAQFLMISKLTEEQLAEGMQFSVICSEDAPRWDLEKVSEDDIKASYLGSSFMESLRAVCAIWPRGVVDADFSTPQLAQTPTLILSGGNDPVTPAAYGERAIKFYPKGRHLIVAGQGHGQVAVGCMPRLLERFISTADAAGLDAKCLDEISAAPFMLSATAPAP